MGFIKVNRHHGNGDRPNKNLSTSRFTPANNDRLLEGWISSGDRPIHRFILGLKQVYEG